MTAMVSLLHPSFIFICLSCWCVGVKKEGVGQQLIPGEKNLVEPTTHDIFYITA